MAESFDIVKRVKADLGLAGNDCFDELLSGHIKEVKRFLVDAGADQEIVESEDSAGVIVRGVSDLWNYGSGEGSLSPYFIQSAIQLVYKSGDGNGL